MFIHIHETKKEYLKRQNKFVKLLYWVGVIKLIPKYNIHKSKWRFGDKLRLIHPLTWLLIVLTFLVNGINKDTLSSIKNHVDWI